MKLTLLVLSILTTNSSVHKIDQGLTTNYIECLVTGQKIVEQVEIVKLKI